MNFKKICSYSGIVILFIILAIMYFSYPLMVMPDSTEYYGYLKIFYGQEPMSQWNIVRGPTYPLTLFIITLIFGNTQKGILIGTFIMFAIMIVIGFFVLRKINYRNKIQKWICYLLYITLIMFNPLLIGYMHGLLTEFVAIPMLFIFAIISFKWMESNNKLWQKILLSAVLVIGSVFMWFVKQPYVFLAVGPITVSAIISIIKNRKLKNVLYRVGIVLVSAIAILISIKLWNTILTINNVDMETGKDTNSFVKTAVINGNTSFSIDFYEDHYEQDYILNSDLISQEDKNEIIKIFNNESEYKSFKLVNVFKDFKSREEDNLERKIAFFSKEDEYTTVDAIKMYFRLLANYPGKTINSYYMNYLALSNLTPSVRHKDANEYYPSSEGGFYFENQSIGYSIYNSETNMLWLNESFYLYDNVKDLKTENTSSKTLNNFINKTFDKVNFIFRVATITPILLLILLIVKLVKLKKKHKENRNIELAIVLIGTAVIHLMFHTLTGAIIDRYAIPVFPGTILAILIILFERNKEKKDEIMKLQKENNPKIKDSKILVVIPAHNEAQNIQKVLDEVKTDLPDVDVLVINDSSTDNTKQIVENNDVKCISTIYNFKYAYAIQTGIKYAYQNNYDYVIQFDGDGQHIAKEAEKLLNVIEEKNCDIVIGSRYLEKGNYKAPFFRKIGTQWFAKLIKIFCKKEISDPLSGFQCLNRRVIEKYSKMGEYPEYPDANLIIDMMTQGYEVEEASVKMRLREFGESMHGGIIKPIKYMLVMFYTVIVILLKNMGKKGK